jgi:leucyl/phenylalanyl-tRNA--protein transferase
MVLKVNAFRLHPSFKKSLKKFSRSPECEIRVDCTFEEVISACANSTRNGTSGTWIVPAMVQAYVGLHHAGLAHSVETWVDGQLVGGLYFVAIGQAVFGESMFHRATDASKIALAALITVCRRSGVTHIDCQQNTRHLASMGAAEISRDSFAQHTRQTIREPACQWNFAPIYWDDLLALDSAIS